MQIKSIFLSSNYAKLGVNSFFVNLPEDSLVTSSNAKNFHQSKWLDTSKLVRSCIQPFFSSQLGLSDVKILEVSKASENPLGVSLSQSNLTIDNVPLGKCYQDSLTFTQGLANEISTGFNYKNEFWEVGLPSTAFYDYLYVKAVYETISEDGLENVLQSLEPFTGFLDIYYDPLIVRHSASRSLALMKTLHEMNLLHNNYTKDSWISMYTTLMEDDVTFNTHLDIIKHS